jgi:hypothetical protein
VATSNAAIHRKYLLKILFFIHIALVLFITD